MTTVSRLTTRARDSERSKAIGRLAIWPFSKTSRNQVKDVPTIGKVTPPLGPWNDNT
jgi:hypothetical protein